MDGLRPFCCEIKLTDIKKQTVVIRRTTIFVLLFVWKFSVQKNHTLHLFLCFALAMTLDNPSSQRNDVKRDEQIYMELSSE